MPRKPFCVPLGNFIQYCNCKCITYTHLIVKNNKIKTFTQSMEEISTPWTNVNTPLFSSKIMLVIIDTDGNTHKLYSINEND